MQITTNTTGFAAGLAVAADVDARDHCVVVVKGTFISDAQGDLTRADEQIPPIETDEHYGDPETTCVRFENDFALRKPMTDVVVVGKAVAPPGQRTRELAVRLEVAGRIKDALVHGERRWVPVGLDWVASTPLTFDEVPLTYDRAFGGADDIRGNPFGVGYHSGRSAAEIAGKPLPNIERPGHEIASPRAHAEAIGFGCVGRTWPARVRLAGTYDQAWLDQHAPYLAPDFDDHYYQCAAADQWFPHFRGGELIRCVHMASEPVVSYRMPSLDVPGRFHFVDRVEQRQGVLDTVILEPHLSRAQLVWRMSVPLGKKLPDLRAIELGPPIADATAIIGRRDGKPHFAGLGAAIRWLRGRGARQP